MISWQTVAQATFNYFLSDAASTTFYASGSTATFDATTVETTFSSTRTQSTVTTQTIAIIAGQPTTTTITGSTTTSSSFTDTATQGATTNPQTITGETTGSTQAIGVSSYNQNGETINGATFQNVLTNQTSTTVEASYFATVGLTTDEAEGQPLFSEIPTTQSISTTGQSGSTTTWTTAMTQKTTTVFISTESMFTYPMLFVTEADTAVGNVYDTIYLADTGSEVLAVADNRQVGQSAIFTTATTISHSVALVPIGIGNSTPLSLVSEGTSDSITYRQLVSSGTSTEYGKNIFAIGTDTNQYPYLQDLDFEPTGIVVTYSTEQATATTTRFQPRTIEHFGNTYSFPQTYLTYTKGKRFINETLQYDLLSFYLTTREYVSSGGPIVFGVGESSGATGGNSTYRTLTAGGNIAITVPKNSPAAFFPDSLERPNRTIYRKGGANLLDGNSGDGYDLGGQSVHVPIRLAQTVRGDGGAWNSLVLPQTNISCTINSDSVTWRENTNRSASNFSATHSAQIGVKGDAKVQSWNSDTVLGGASIAEETTVQSIPSGAWSDVMNNQTTFVSVAEHALVSASSPRSYFKPLPFCVYNFTPPVIAVPALEIDWQIPGIPQAEV